MDDISIHLIEDRTPLCEDIVRYINSFAVREELNDNNFKEARDLWFNDKNLCIWRFGHISNWNTSKITDMSYTFENRREFNEDISKWDVSNVKNMSGMFSNAFDFNSDISGWNVSNVKNMQYMFFYASSFNCDISRWDVSNVESMYLMFLQATSFNRNYVKDWNYKYDEVKTDMFG